MSIIFDEIAHTYTDDRTGEQPPSVNQIINAVYGSGYEYVKKEILNARAERGKEIHADAYNWLTAKRYYSPENIEIVELSDWFERNMVDLKVVEPEKIVYVPGMFAGTADLITGPARGAHLWDYKTNINKPTKKMLAHWQMQLSFYKYALDRMGYKIEQMTILHLVNTTCTPYELEYLGDQFVIDTWKAFKEGRKIEKPKETSLQTVNKRAVQKLQRTLEKIATLEKEIAPIREQIKQEMEKRGITALEIGKISVTYVGPGKRKKFDTERFKAENGPLYYRYITETDVKSSIRIKVNEKKESV